MHVRDKQHARVRHDADGFCFGGERWHSTSLAQKRRVDVVTSRICCPQYVCVCNMIVPDNMIVYNKKHVTFKRSLYTDIYIYIYVLFCVVFFFSVQQIVMLLNK